MTHQLVAVIMGVCVFLSAFFSGSETAVTAVNRYRLHYLANVKKNKSAQILSALLQKPQRVLGMILIANTFLNVLLSSLATALTIVWLGQKYVLVVTLLLTIVILICAEVLPKSIAAYHSDYIAYAVAPILRVLLILLGPIVAVIDGITRVLLRCFGISISGHRGMHLSRDELGSLIRQRVRGQQSDAVEHMLEGVLDLASITVEDVMCPRTQMKGVDISQPWSLVIQAIRACDSDHILLYRKSLDHLLGTVATHTLLVLMFDNRLNKEALLAHVEKPVYVPEVTSLESQMKRFSINQKRFAFVVDEYGQVTGVVESKDIIDEITGVYASGYAGGLNGLLRHNAGQYWFDGNVSVRDVNKLLHWGLPEDRANTIGGLVVEYLECIPDGLCAVQIDGYRIEILSITNNKVGQLKIVPPQQSSRYCDKNAC